LKWFILKLELAGIEGVTQILYKLPVGKNKEVQKLIDEKREENFIFNHFVAG
jgi:hypothetical protein